MPEATSGAGPGKPGALLPHRKIDVKREPPVGGVSVFTLIRTDTTLDHSQKAEKVCKELRTAPKRKCVDEAM